MAFSEYLNNKGRQEVISAVQLLDFDEINLAVASGRLASLALIPAFDIPAKAVLISGSVKVISAFDATRTLAITLDGDTLVAAADLASVGTTALTIPTKQYADPEVANLAISGAITQGKALVILEYVIEGRSAFSHG